MKLICYFRSVIQQNIRTTHATCAGKSCGFVPLGMTGHHAVSWTATFQMDFTEFNPDTARKQNHVYDATNTTRELRNWILDFAEDNIVFE